MRTLNLGILAHVDAGKTSLTEHLLFAAGAIDALGSVDKGNTHTDTLDQERHRGITIKSAVASFSVGDTCVNLIDTPGHPDFIAEVERVLRALDGVILVISAVESVQVQTRVLMRAIRRLNLPCLIFVNKIDRAGAEVHRVLQDVAEKLSSATVALGRVSACGSADAAYHPYTSRDEAHRVALADELALHSDAVLELFIRNGGQLDYVFLKRELAAQAKCAQIYPLIFGSAISGAGVAALLSGIVDLLPASEPNADGPMSGIVFKIERHQRGGKRAFVRMLSGCLRVRDSIGMGHRSGKVTSIQVFEHGEIVARETVGAGQIAKISGFEAVQIGDVLGKQESPATAYRFAPPTLETRVVPLDQDDAAPLYAALSYLADQDPLINLRHDESLQQIALSLYGEVQKEVIKETLRTDFGIEVEFQETTMICVEKLAGSGAALEVAPDPYVATVGLRLEPGEEGSGVVFSLEVPDGALPPAYFVAVEEAARASLRHGRYGWEVTDCVISMTHHIRRRHWASLTTPAEHRALTPLVVAKALEQAGTRVYQPIHGFQLDLPSSSFGAVIAALAKHKASYGAPVTRGNSCTLEGEISAASVCALQKLLPSLTSGEGMLETTFSRYELLRDNLRRGGNC
ncbi:translation factor GTPase family protein [Burkholderia alba]|uniref:translation factor GTPase family protein n=1 Tax=Burkholderia alba TaxID=2683677 RepID=UPI002B059299|nr:translation factor GTPase family protein [Burkholderia alba]